MRQVLKDSPLDFDLATISCRPEQKGTCWQECKCSDSGECSYQDSCTAFTCDEKEARQKGSQPECVVDNCEQVSSTASESYTPLHLQKALSCFVTLHNLAKYLVSLPIPCNLV